MGPYSGCPLDMILDTGVIGVWQGGFSVTLVLIGGQIFWTLRENLLTRYAVLLSR